MTLLCWAKLYSGVIKGWGLGITSLHITFINETYFSLEKFFFQVQACVTLCVCGEVGGTKNCRNCDSRL